MTSRYLHAMPLSPNKSTAVFSSFRSSDLTAMTDPNNWADGDPTVVLPRVAKKGRRVSCERP
jgi:hypothetical protein